ncbi:MAG: TRAP transporter small permease [Candidatus Thiodiazotropha sp. (ex Rostrolucina anterorostrata)]|nr:TRAP transporter small permease [Candidatus Thiodiazotropha sp. (ex Rostrolucina anterorostrata)]
MSAFIRFTDGLSRLLGMVAAILLVIAVVVVCQMVFMRYGLGQSTHWQTEFVTYTLIASTFLGAPYVLLTRGHVNVELVPMAVGGRKRFLLALIAYSCSAILCLLLAYYSFLFWHEAWEAGWRSESIWAPKLWKVYLSMPLGFIAISLQYLTDLICLITGRAPPLRHC